jgi:membrane protein YqaA with SNARE-associated domain
MNRQTIFSGLLIGMAALIYSQLNDFPAVQETLRHWSGQLISFLTSYGLLGAFLNSFISNASLGMPIPYTPFFIFLVSQAKSTMFLITLIIISAIGCTLGEIVSFYIGRGVSTAFFKENKTAAFINNVAEKRPKLISLCLFLGAATPFPDDLIVIPLGLMNYPAVRMIVPIFLGKATFLGVMAYLSHYAYLTAADYVSLSGIDPTIFVLVVIVVMIFMVYRGKGRPEAIE